MRKTKTSLLSVAAAGVLAASLAACGSSGGSTTANSSSGSSGAASSPAASPSPVAALTNLTGVSTSVKLDPGFLSAITGLGLKPATIGKATLDATTGVVSFPITGGNATYYTPGTVSPYVTGEIMHEGSGLALSNATSNVELENFVVNPGTSMLTGTVLVDKKPFATDVPLFFLDGRTLQPLSKDADGNGVLTGTIVKLTPQAAAALNKVFGTTKVPNYLTVGVATITLKLS